MISMLVVCLVSNLPYCSHFLEMTCVDKMHGDKYKTIIYNKLFSKVGMAVTKAVRVGRDFFFFNSSPPPIKQLTTLKDVLWFNEKCIGMVRPVIQSMTLCNLFNSDKIT